MNTSLEHRKILRSNLGLMRHLGAGHHIFEHWYNERLCAIGVAPLSIWFIIQMLRLTDADHKKTTQWIAQPINTVLLLSLMILTFQHMRLGLEVITSDYARGKKRDLLNLAIKGGTLLVGLFSIVSILKIAFTTPPSKK